MAKERTIGQSTDKVCTFIVQSHKDGQRDGEFSSRLQASYIADHEFKHFPISPFMQRKERTTQGPCVTFHLESAGGRIPVLL